MAKQRVLFVCLGNICRSPLAEGVARALDHDQRLEWDSAGTGDWHIGQPPHPPMIKAAARMGYDLSALRARQVRPEDLQEFDLVIAMDGSNLRDLHSLAERNGVTPKKLRLLRVDGMDVADPYYGGPEAFAECVTVVEKAIATLLQELHSSQQRD